MSEIRRIQSTYGRDAFGVLGGASMTTEKTYLMGKFARVALRTRHIDYNGRLCMVSAARQQEGLRHRPAQQLGRPARDRGDRRRRDQHRRVLPRGHAVLLGPRTAGPSWWWSTRGDGHGPHRRRARGPAARHDAAFYNGMLHVIARDGLTDERFIAEHTVGWEAVRDTVAGYTPEQVGEICGLDPPRSSGSPTCGAGPGAAGRPTGAGWSSTSRASRTCSRAST